MKICVVGGAGFIGSNFIHYMINKYRNIFVFFSLKMQYFLKYIDKFEMLW